MQYSCQDFKAEVPYKNMGKKCDSSNIVHISSIEEQTTEMGPILVKSHMHGVNFRSATHVVHTTKTRNATSIHADCYKCMHPVYQQQFSV